MLLLIKYQLNLTAQTGTPHPNISTTFMGRSRPLDDVWRHTPRSAEPREMQETASLDQR